MRRDVKKQFMMTEAEAKDFARKAEGACMSEARLIRMLVAGFVPPAAPDDRFYEAMEEVRSFYDRLQQITAGLQDEELKTALTEEIRAWKDFRMTIQEQYLGREESKHQWL